ncbi:MAG: hypothetical protein M1405_01465 [Patescibacteria group bacterium]|nr:hypothetical protein [Patescibacteria group bacterium]
MRATEQEVGIGEPNQEIAVIVDAVNRNGYTIVQHRVHFLYRDQWGDAAYDVDGELPLPSTRYLDYIALGLTEEPLSPLDRTDKVMRYLIYDPYAVDVLVEARELSSTDPLQKEEANRWRRVATRTQMTILTDSPRWGIVAVKRRPQLSPRV